MGNTDPGRKVRPAAVDETGRQFSDLAVSIGVGVVLPLCGFGALAVGALLPSWLVLAVIVVLVVARLVRGDR